MFTLQILLPALCACVIMTVLLAYLGMHVLAREVIFVDIALAQIAALGAAVGSFFGIEPHTPLSYACALGFTTAGAGVFAAARSLRHRVPQEAFIGVTYAVAAALAVLVANFLPHGDEEIKEILVGSLLTVETSQVVLMAIVFAVVGLVHLLLRHRFLECSFGTGSGPPEDINAALWDFFFYVSLGLVITSAVQAAGVLLVFSFLVVPAVFSALFARRLAARLAIAWVFGIGVSVLGLWGSFWLDVPSGAAVVMAFGAALLAATLARAALRRRSGVEAALVDSGLAKTGAGRP
jgi:zinc/manganese transport system permease protein